MTCFLLTPSSKLGTVSQTVVQYKVRVKNLDTIAYHRKPTRITTVEAKDSEF